MALGWYYEWIERLYFKGYKSVAKMAGYCGACFSGQLGLWYYLIEYRSEWRLFDHIGFVCLTIFIFIQIKQWQDKKGLN